MDGPWGNDAKWNKPVRKDKYLLYVESKKRKNNKFIDTENRWEITKGKGGLGKVGEMEERDQKGK